MRSLVTGANGFVGRYLSLELQRRGHEVVRAGRVADGAAADRDIELELGDAGNVREAVEAARAGAIFHLAAQSFVPRATENPIETYEINVLGTARLIDAIRDLPKAERPRLIFVSSSEVYGARAQADLPFRETLPPAPATPYAASKLAGEGIVLASARAYGFSALVTRAFNQIGPGQNERFVVPAFAARLARIAAGGDPLLAVGNLETKRDFLDVRDVVRAYADLADRGADGEVYNVCSGTPTAIVEILRKLVTIAHVGVEIREAPALVRSVDVPLVYGDNTKLREATGWEPATTLIRTLRDIYEYAAKDVAARV